jgi:hypothetical protein
VGLVTLVETDAAGDFIAVTKLPGVDSIGFSDALNNERARLRGLGAVLGPGHHDANMAPMAAIRRGYRIVAVDPTADDLRKLARR